MKNEKNNLDEMQELKLLKIEHNGCWMAFWGLLAAMLIQMLIGNNSLKNLAGEWIVFMCLAIYLISGCMKNGIWDRKLKPDFKTNAAISGIAALAMGIFMFIVSYVNSHVVIAAGIAAIMVSFIVGILCLAALMIFSYLHKKRSQKLEEADEN